MQKLTEADLDAHINAKLAAVRAAKPARRAARNTCPPCAGNCSQGRQCPERAAALRRKVLADQAEAMPSTTHLLAVSAAAVLCTVLVSMWLGI